MKLYRPVGLRELELIAEAGFKAYPPRLPDQPFFYPVLNFEYAEKIARDWNAKDAFSGHAGFVTEFEVEQAVLDQYERRVVGSSTHEELWVPAEELSAFNAQIVDKIHVTAHYLGPDAAFTVDPETHLPQHLLTGELPPLSVDALINRIEAGYQPEYLLFWGHTGEADRIGPECLSQWYPASFEIDGMTFPTAEHYMMFAKARLFRDPVRADGILAAATPGEAKALGRKVEGFDEQIWAEQRFDVVVTGNIAKFGQNSALAEYLLNTGQRVLVEASPRDRIWGIGYGRNNPAARQPSEWRGLNLLGFALMQARHRLMIERADS